MPRFSLRTLLIAVALVAAYFPCSELYVSWVYKRLEANHGYHYVLMLLHSEFRNGDSLHEVATRFENVRLLSANNTQEMENIRNIWAMKKLTIEVDDQFMFGPDLLVAPVLYEGARERTIYLPAGATWTDAWTTEVYEGDQSITANAPLERIPVYLRNSASLPIRVATAKAD